MTQIRSRRTLTGMALSWGLVLASTGSAQTRIPTIQVDGKANLGTAVLPPIKAAPQHLGKGPIDLNNLPQDVLDCDVCRQRLGLPPRSNLAGFKESQPAAATAGRILGSPGMMSSVVTEQMAQQGYVVEEFKPPQPAADAIQLGVIPPEARERFLRSLNLPQGARVMSAEVKGREISAQPARSNSNARLNDGTRREEGSLGTPGIVTQPETITPKSATLGLGTAADKDMVPNVSKSESENTLSPPLTQQPASESQPTPNSLPQPVAQLEIAAREQFVLVQTIDQLQKKLEEQAAEQSKLNAMLERLQSENQKRMERADAANREALTMLEKRTAEVTELQLKLKSQQDAMEKMELKSKESNDKRPESSKAEATKKEQNKGKGKKPTKPSGDA